LFLEEANKKRKKKHTLIKQDIAAFQQLKQSAPSFVSICVHTGQQPEGFERKRPQFDYIPFVL
jgi:hypothetical protein